MEMGLCVCVSLALEYLDLHFGVINGKEFGGGKCCTCPIGNVFWHAPPSSIPEGLVLYTKQPICSNHCNKSDHEIGWGVFYCILKNLV